ncbi:MFS transporter [Trueperella pyogenes]|uniref:MFS transporter n=1 Tax=Trueperella pyogenes TaxID=1661 RepID=UPI00345D10ED
MYERIAQLEGRTHEPNLGADCPVHKGKVSVITLFRHHLPNVVRVMMMAQYAITGVLLSNYLLNYATTYWGWERQTLLSLATMTMMLGLPTQPLWAALSDRIGRRPVYIISMVSLIVSFPVVFWSVQLENIGLLTTTMVVMGLMATGGNVVQAPLYTEIFPTEVRMTGYAVSTQLGNIIVGFTPMIAAMLVRPGAFGWVPVLIFTTIMMGMGVIACLLTKETMGAVIVAE